MPITEDDLPGLDDGDVLSTAGDRIGRIAQIYVDDQTGEPTFVTATTGLFGRSQSFVPLRGARAENGNLVVQFDKTTVKDAPRVADDGSLSPSEEDALYAYYGMSHSNLDNADYGLADQTPDPGDSHAGPVPAVSETPVGPSVADAPADEGAGRLRRWVPGGPAPTETGPAPDHPPTR